MDRLNLYMRYFSAEDNDFPYERVGRGGFLPWDYLHSELMRFNSYTKSEALWVLDNLNDGRKGAMFLYYEDDE